MADGRSQGAQMANTLATTSAVSGQPTRRMKVGIAGLGVGANAVVKAMEQAPFMDLVAAADVRPQALAAFQQRYGGKGYDSVEGLANDPDVEVIWVSTPNKFHCEHT